MIYLEGTRVDEKKSFAYKIRIPRETATTNNPEEVEYHSRLRPAEQSALMQINGAKVLIEDSEPDIDIRLQKLGIRWMYKGMLGLIRKVSRMLEASAEKEQLLTLALRARHLRTYVAYDSKAGSDPEGSFFRLDDINEIIRTVLEDTCGLCSKTGAEARNCPLQKALKACTTLPDKREIDGCMFKPYTNANYYGLFDEDAEETQ